MSQLQATFSAAAASAKIPTPAYAPITRDTNTSFNPDPSKLTSASPSPSPSPSPSIHSNTSKMDVRINIDVKDDGVLEDDDDSNSNPDSPLTLATLPNSTSTTLPTRCPNIYQLYLQQNMDVEIHIIHPVTFSTIASLPAPAPTPAPAPAAADTSMEVSMTEIKTLDDDDLWHEDSVSTVRVCNAPKSDTKNQHILLANRSILSAASTKLRDMLDAANAAALESTTTRTSTSSSTSSSPSRLKLLIDDPRITPLTMMRLLHDIYRRHDLVDVDIHMDKLHVRITCINNIQAVPNYNINRSLPSYDNLPPICYLSELSDLLYVAIKYDVSSLINKICWTVRHSYNSRTSIRYHLIVEPYRGHGYACIDSLCDTLSAAVSSRLAAFGNVNQSRNLCLFCCSIFIATLVGIILALLIHDGIYYIINNTWFQVLVPLGIIWGIALYIWEKKYPNWMIHYRYVHIDPDQYHEWIDRDDIDR